MKKLFKKIFSSLDVVIGVILIWRGIWVLFDRIEHWLFGYDTAVIAVASIVLGFLLVYLHDHKIDELGHL